MPRVVGVGMLGVVNGEALEVDTGEMLEVVNGGGAGFCSEPTCADSRAS